MYCDSHVSFWRTRPVERDFELEIVSRHPEFDGKKLRKFGLEGIETVGVYGDEPFELHFRNNSYEDVQVRVSLDGTDVMTGKLANLEVDHAMWLVRAHTTLHLRAWHESQAGGARFVFTHNENSVALHTHGDISHKGIISVAVFTDADRPQQILNRTERDALRRNFSVKSASSKINSGEGYYQGNTSKGGRIGGSRSDTYSYSVPDAVPAAAGSATMDYMNIDRERDISDESMNIKKTAAVGAGEYVEQRTRTVKGLNKPVLNSILRVRYMWWDDVMAKLKESRNSDPFPTGFPAEKIRSFADLSGVPKIESAAANRTVAEQVFDRLL